MLKAMTIRTKLYLGFFSVLALMVVVALIGYSGIGKAVGAIGDIVYQLEIAKKANTILVDAQDAQAHSLRYIIYKEERYAARAGEAGKGFAVVANEIKALALQTAEASREIQGRIEGIQGATGETVQQIEKISGVISEVNEIVSTIASAVEEQSAATREIFENIGQASMGIREVNENVAQSSAFAGNIAKDIAEVNDASRDVAEGSGSVQSSAADLMQLNGRLQDLMAQFKISVAGSPAAEAVA